MVQATRALRRGYDDRAAAMLEVAGPQSEEEPDHSDESEHTDSDAEHARCARCGSTRNLELLLPTGPFADAPMEQRIFCQECIQA